MVDVTKPTSPLTSAPAPTPPPKITQGRSPAYPYIPLGKAIERLQKVVDAGVGRNAYPPETLYQIWELGAQSSGARQTLAALNHFGLVDYDGRGDVRKVKVSELGLKIALDKIPGSSERAQALQLAALTPPIHSDLYQRYRHHLPADVVLLTYLTRDCGYNPGAASSLIEEYKDTLSYTSLDKPIAEVAVSEPLEDVKPAAAKVGDSVLIEIDGSLLFSEPKRVEEIQEYEGEKWVFVEGERTAVRMDQVVVQQTTVGQRQVSPPPTRVVPSPKAKEIDDILPSGWTEERLIDDGNEEIKIRYAGGISVERYKFIRDYLDFKIKRLEKNMESKPLEAN